MNKLAGSSLTGLPNFWAESKKGVNVCAGERVGREGEKGQMTPWRKKLRTAETVMRVNHQPSEDKLRRVMLREMQIKVMRGLTLDPLPTNRITCQQLETGKQIL